MGICRAGEFRVEKGGRRGWRLKFDREVNRQTFDDACGKAIALAKRHCPIMDTVAVCFVAMGVEVQVVESSRVDVQRALWERGVERNDLQNAAASA